MTGDRFDRDRAVLRAKLEERARRRQVITYADAAALVGRVSQGLARLLDAIRAEEAAAGRPDLTSLVVAVSTGLPRQVGSGEDARERAIAVQEAVFAAWAPK